ncbi:MAG: redoxin domain-containing protein, partial [Thermoproteota archaeon]|nr:redoxin domain-containing protein [Thermoproteota archaeon]
MQENPLEIKEGTIAPDFEFRDGDGNIAKLSDLQGRKDVVIYFYPKDFTPGCSMQATEFTRDYEKFKDAGIEIVGVS